MEQVHIFELAGLGKGPFRFLYEIEEPHQSCDYCGHEIRWNEIIESADGRIFKVGNECVLKTGDAGLVDPMNEAKKARERAKRAQKAAEKAAKKRAEKAAREAEYKAWRAGVDAAIEAKRNELLPLLQDATEWLVKVLDKHTRSGFCRDLAYELETQFKTIQSRSPRCVAILRDIYAKDHGRSNSKAYKAAEVEFDNLIEVTDTRIAQLYQDFHTTVMTANKAA